jgi:hypothetical protein
LDGNETLEHICVGVAPLDLRLSKTQLGLLGFNDCIRRIKSGIPDEQMLGFEIREKYIAIGNKDHAIAAGDAGGAGDGATSNQTRAAKHRDSFSAIFTVHNSVFNEACLRERAHPALHRYASSAQSCVS